MLFVAVYHLCTVVQASLEPVPVQLLRFAILAAFVFVLVVITFIDIDHKLILDRVTYPAIPIFYLLGTLLPGRGFREGLIGAVVGYGIVRLVADGYYYLTGREGLGYGDGKLLAVIGALLGWRAVVVSLFLGSLAGTVGAGLALIAARWRGRPAAHGGAPEQAEVALRHTEVPFGPFLAFGALVHVFLEPWLQVNFTPLW
jgi:leader peptidase (prepilin peptidase)/N-methyltransferase